MSKMAEVQIPLPIVIMKEGTWFVASCPLLDVATQGKTEEEVKENMQNLIDDYLRDPDTPKPELKAIMATSLANIPINVPEKVLHGKAKIVTSP